MKKYLVLVFSVFAFASCQDLINIIEDAISNGKFEGTYNGSYQSTDSSKTGAWKMVVTKNNVSGFILIDGKEKVHFKGSVIDQDGNFKAAGFIEGASTTIRARLVVREDPEGYIIKAGVWSYPHPSSGNLVSENFAVVESP